MNELPTIVAKAIPFGVPSENLGGFVEVISPEAVTRTLRQGTDVVALVGHDVTRVLGRTAVRTMRLDKRRDALWAEIDPPDTTFVSDLIAGLRHRDAPGVSFTFRVPDENGETWRVQDGQILRTVLDMELREISVGVAFPAYASTNTSLRSLTPWKNPRPPGRLLAVAQEQQRIAAGLETRALKRDGEMEHAWLRDGTGHTAARSKALRSAAVFLDACRRRYGSLEDTPLDTPSWSERPGWEDEGAGKDAFRARKVRQERAVREAAASDRAQEERDRDAQRAAVNWQRTMAEWRARNHSTPRSY